MGGEALDLGCLAAVVRERGLAHLYTTEAPYLRIGHFVRGETSWFMLFWEGVQGEVDEVIELPCKGDFLRLDLLHGKISRGFTVDGRVQVRLVPYQSELLMPFRRPFWRDFRPGQNGRNWTLPRLSGTSNCWSRGRKSFSGR